MIMRALFQIYEGFVGGFEGVGVDVGPDGDLGGEGKEFLYVLTGAVGNAAYDFFVVEVSGVVKGGDGGHVDAGEGEDAAFNQVFKGQGDQFSGRGEDYGGVEFAGRAILRTADPCGTQVSG